MTTYCAPCLADLALVREAVTSVSGTAACVAHAVLLTHPTDNPQRRLTRLSELREMAEAKLTTASAEDVPAIELLVQEYALAGAMDMTVPLKDLAGDRTPRPPKPRRDRGRDRGRDREGRPENRPGDRPDNRGPRTDAAVPASGEATTSTPEPAAPAPEVSAAPAAPATPEADSSPAPTPAPSPEPSAPAPSPEPSAPAPAPEPSAPSPAPEPTSPAPEVTAAPAAPAPPEADSSPAPAPASAPTTEAPVAE